MFFDNCNNNFQTCIFIQFVYISIVSIIEIKLKTQKFKLVSEIEIPFDEYMYNVSCLTLSIKYIFLVK